MAAVAVWVMELALLALELVQLMVVLVAVQQILMLHLAKLLDRAQ